MLNRLAEGRAVYLRPVVPADATDDYVAWLNDPETTRFLESGRREETKDSIARYIADYSNRDDARFLAIMLREDDRHVGNVKLEPINWVHRNAVLGIMIGDPAARGRGVGTDTMITVLRYAFRDLGLHRVTLGVRADNDPAIHCYKKVGFTEEGRWREGVRNNNDYIDQVWMGIIDREFDALHG